MGDSLQQTQHTDTLDDLQQLTEQLNRLLGPSVSSVAGGGWAARRGGCPKRETSLFLSGRVGFCSRLGVLGQSRGAGRGARYHHEMFHANAQRVLFAWPLKIAERTTTVHMCAPPVSPPALLPRITTTRPAHCRLLGAFPFNSVNIFRCNKSFEVGRSSR